MKKIQTFINLLFITTFLLIFLNLILGWTWELRTKIKFKNFTPYDNVVLDALNLTKEDALILYLETFIDRKFDYEQFTEHSESNDYENKFVNVTPELGRKTISPKICNKTIFFYGGSTTFGYNVADFQTIPSYLGKKLIEANQDVCVKNFGRGSYFSTQETILFQKHILNNNIQQDDIVIFLDGINENGNRNSRNTRFLFQVNRALNQKYWDMYKYTFPIFFESLAINQLVKRIQEKLNLKKKTKLDQGNIFELQDELKSVYEKNILIRNGICKTNNLNCYNLLQPFATLHGKYFEKPTEGAIENRVLDINQKKNLLRKYQLLKDVPEIIDISDSLDNAEKLSYVDNVHYSPNANKKIADTIFEIILDNIN